MTHPTAEDDKLKMAGEKAKKTAAEINNVEDDIVDTGVRFDGSWQKRGWTSRSGVATAISESAGQLLDIMKKQSLKSD